MITLSKSQRSVLETMLDKRDDWEGELVYSQRQCYLGYDRVDSRIFFNLLRRMAISMDSYSRVGDFEIYRINETGINLLEKGTLI